MIRIANGKIITANGIIEDKYLYIKGKKIEAVTAENLPFDEEIDAEGYYVSAGFIDIHLHGGADGDFSNGSVEENVAAMNFHAAHGTTSLFPTLLSASYEGTVSALEAIRETIDCDKVLPNVCGVHIEGPYFSQKQCGAQNKAFITPPVVSDYAALLKNYGDIIRRWSFAPENEGTAAFIDALNEKNVISSIAHSDAVYEDVEAVYNKGCKIITHFYSCISTITREKGMRRLGITECGYLFDDMVVEAIADGRHIPKRLFELLYKIKGREQICLVTDAMSCAGSNKTISSIGGVPCKIKNGVAYLMDESGFAGSIATADRLIRFCVNEVGIDICSAVKMMSENPARIMRIPNKGKLEKGFDADVVIFDDDIHVKTVLVGGSVINA